MKIRALLLALCAALSVAVGGWTVAASDSQEGKSQIIVPMQSGAFVQIATESVPPGLPDVSLSFIESEATPNPSPRIRGKKGRRLFAARASVEPVAGHAAVPRYRAPLERRYEQTLPPPLIPEPSPAPDYNASASTHTTAHVRRRHLRARRSAPPRPS